jgi:hypothetical protein
MDKHLLSYLNIGRNAKAIEVVRPLWDKALQLADVHTWQICLTSQDFFCRFEPYAQNSRAISDLLAKATHVGLMAVSIGSGLETMARQYLGKNEPFKGYMLNRIGNYLVEQQIRKIDKRMARLMEKNGNLTTRRYSPGYKDFSLETQMVFVKLIHDGIPDLQVMAGGLLKPEKTITALKGLTLIKNRAIEKTLP